MSDFDALILALEEWFETALCGLPDALRKRVEQEFFPMPWDNLTADQRRSFALQLDYQHDPATVQDQKLWWDFFERVDGLKKQLAEWESVATLTAAELALKETRLVELKLELTRLDAQKQLVPGDYYPERRPSGNEHTAKVDPIVNTTAQTRERRPTVQREVRKLQTQKRHSSWQKAYRNSIKKHPAMSDVWHAKQIVKMEIGRGVSPDTIRKNMKIKK